MEGEAELPTKQNGLINASKSNVDLNFDDGQADVVDAPVEKKTRGMTSPEKRPSRMPKVDADKPTKKSKSKNKAKKKRTTREGSP